MTGFSSVWVSSLFLLDNEEVVIVVVDVDLFGFLLFVEFKALLSMDFGLTDGVWSQDPFEN